MLSFRNDSDACIVIIILQVSCLYVGDLFFTVDTLIVLSLIAHL